MEIKEAEHLVEFALRNIYGYEVRYRKSLTGCVYSKKKLVYIPSIKSRKSLYIALHELYHVERAENKLKKIEVNVEEMRAELFAHRKMREMGFAVPTSQTQRAKRYVAYKVRKAIKRGKKLENIDKEVLRFIK